MSQGRGSRQAEPQKRFAKVWCLQDSHVLVHTEQMVLPMPTPCVYQPPPLSGIFLFSLRDTVTTSPSLPALGRRLKRELCVLINLPRKEVGAAPWTPGLGPPLLAFSGVKL